MSKPTRSRRRGPWLMDLRPPASVPVLPCPAAPRLSDDAIIDWYTLVLQSHIEQFFLGDPTAREWVNRIDLDDPLSFVNLCRFFHVDPYRMQARIEEWAAHHKRRGRGTEGPS